MEKLLGIICLLLVGGVVVLMIYSSIYDALYDYFKEYASQLAYKLYREWVRNTRFRVVQRLEIKDEMEVRS